MPEYLIRVYSIALNSTLMDKMEKWNMNYFREFLSQYNPALRCAMEKTLHALRAEFMEKKSTSKIDLEH